MMSNVMHGRPHFHAIIIYAQCRSQITDPLIKIFNVLQLPEHFLFCNAQYKRNVFCRTLLCLNQHNLVYLGQAEQRKKATMQFFFLLLIASLPYMRWVLGLCSKKEKEIRFVYISDMKKMNVVYAS